MVIAYNKTFQDRRNVSKINCSRKKNEIIDIAAA